MRTGLWLSGRWHLAQARQPKHKNREKKNKTAAFLKAYSQQHEPRGQRTNITQKNAALNTILGERVVWLTGIKPTEAALSQRGAATATTSPLSWREANLERVWAEDRKVNTHAHTHTKPRSASPSTSFKEQNHHGWTAPILMSSISKLAITLPVKMTIQQSAHCRVSQSSYPWCVCVYKTNIYCYRLLYNWGLSLKGNRMTIN